MPATSSPRAFLSYAHETPHHVDTVLALANRLRKDGIDARLDRYHPAPPEGCRQWSERQIDDANFILVLCSPTYRQRFEGRAPPGEGLGATWEGRKIATWLYQQQGHNPKILPILLGDTPKSAVPDILLDYHRYHLPRDYEDLLRKLTDQPEILVPPVGSQPHLPPRPSPAFNVGTLTPPSPSPNTPFAPTTPSSPTPSPSQTPTPDLTLVHPSTQTILFIAASPSSMARLELDTEIRDIEHRLRATRHRDAFIFKPQLAATPDDLQEALLRVEPTLVHFSGHGLGIRGVAMHGRRPEDVAVVSTDALKHLLSLFRTQIRLVVINACNSTTQAQQIAEVIEFAVGMKGPVSDAACNTFAAAFYRALGFGRSIQTAFDLGINALKLEGLTNDEARPVLHTRPGAPQASTVTLVGDSQPPSSDHQPPPETARNDTAILTASPTTLTALRRALTHHDLIPFVGSGLSRAGGLPTWPELLHAVRAEAVVTSISPADLTAIDTLITRGQLIDALTEFERHLGAAAFTRIITALLDDRTGPNGDPRPVPDVLHALADLAPQLRAVITTNLDAFLPRAFPREWQTFDQPVGDLARRRRYILQLHGALHDRRTWVLTRDAYDRVMERDRLYHEYFSAVLLGQPLLFIGFGLTDPHFERLIQKIRALSQGQPPQHFALVLANDITAAARRRFGDSGIELIGYPSHATLPAVLRSLTQPSS